MAGTQKLKTYHCVWLTAHPMARKENKSFSYSTILCNPVCFEHSNKLQHIMSIILKILIGLGLLILALVVIVFVSYLVVVISHERRWRKSISEHYGTFSDEKKRKR